MIRSLLLALLPGEATRYLRWWRLRLRFPGLRADKSSDVCGLSSFEAPTQLYPGARVWQSRLGAYSYLGADALAVKAVIGRFTSIAPRAIVGGGVHPSREWVSTAPCFFSSKSHVGRSFVDEDLFDELPETRIGNDVWIGYSAVILPGVDVGDGAIIGAGSVVTKSVPAYAIVTGVPASTRRFRFNSGEIAALLDSKWWDWPVHLIKERASWFRNMETWKNRWEELSKR